LLQFSDQATSSINLLIIDFSLPIKALCEYSRQAADTPSNRSKHRKNDRTNNRMQFGDRLSKQLFLNLHSLDEDIIEEVRERMESGKLKATFRDVYYVSTAKEKSWQQAYRIEERKKETGYTRNVMIQEDYEKTLAAARRKLG